MPGVNEVAGPIRCRLRSVVVSRVQGKVGQSKARKGVWQGYRHARVAILLAERAGHLRYGVMSQNRLRPTPHEERYPI